MKWLAVVVFSVSIEASEIAGSFVRDQALHDLLENGNSTLAYTQFQIGVRHFSTRNGTVSYERHLGKTLVLGDPLASDLEALLDEFLSVHRRPFFCGITEKTAEALHRRGYYINLFGQDPRIDLANYSIEGPKKQKLRQAWNKFNSSNLTIVEGSDDPAYYRDAAQSITQAWIQDKSVSEHEVRFLTRPIVYEKEDYVRKFFVLDESGVPLALYYFDPIFQNGDVIGYSTSFKRRKKEAMTGLEEAVFVWAVERFKAEGKQMIQLGLIPLYHIDDDSVYRRHQWLHYDLANLYRWGDGIVYSFRGHADFKHRFRGVDTPVYLASKDWLHTRGSIAMLKASGLKWDLKPTFKALGSACMKLFKKTKKNENAPRGGEKGMDPTSRPNQ